MHTTRNVWSHMFDAVLTEYPALDPLKVLAWPMREIVWWYDRIRDKLHRDYRRARPSQD